MYELGLRRQDVITLTWGVLLKKKSGFSQGKTSVEFYSSKQKKTRSVTISASLFDRIKEEMDREKEFGKMVNMDCKILQYGDPNSFGLAMKRIMKANGFPKAQTHDFRVSKVTQMFGETGNIEECREFLGHRDTKTTLFYIKENGRTLWK